MAKMVEFDGGKVGVMLDQDRQETALTVAADGEVGVMALYPVDDSEEQPPHAYLLEGIAKAFADPDLFEQLQAIAHAAQGMDWGDIKDTGTDTPPGFENPPTRH